MKEKIQKFAELILESENIVALTGAGMSTESGIPDFRSPGTGLWERMDPSFADISTFTRNPTAFYQTMLEIGLNIIKAKPNAGHKSLRKLQKMGKLNGIMTQNIDGLHKRAHTKNVIELHGNINEAKCMGKCGKIFPITTLINKLLHFDAKSTKCPDCGGVLKPNAVFFGEQLPTEALERTDELIANCDLMMILGTSLLVSPANFLPYKALNVDAKLGIINREKTNIDHQCLVVIHGSIAEILPKIVEIVEIEYNKK